MRGFSGSNNPFSVTPALAMVNPAESYMSGLRIKANREALESQRESQERQNEFMAQWQTTAGDPVAQLELMRRYPEMAKMVRDQYDFASDMSAQWQIDDNQALLKANSTDDAIAILQDRARRLSEAGIPDNETRATLKRALNGATLEELKAEAEIELMGSDDGRQFLEARAKQGQLPGDTELGKMYNLRSRIEQGGGQYKNQRLAEIDRKIEQMVTQIPNTSAGAQEFAMLTAGLDDSQKAQAALIKLGLAPRAVGKANHVVNVGDVPHMVTYDAQGNPSMSPITLSTGENVTPEKVGGDKGTVAGMVARETEIGRAEGGKIATAANDLQKSEQMIGLINKAISHPGREAATGASSITNRAAIPGSDRKNFLVLADQLRGQNFLEAYQSLKGGGQITEFEGEKAEQAQARLNMAQSEEEYVNALNEMKSLLEERAAKTRALMGDAAPSADPTLIDDLVNQYSGQVN